MTDFKKDTRTPQEQAEARYPDDCENLQGHTHRTEFQRGRMHGCLDCITEQVTPRDEFIAELVGHMEVMRKSLATYGPHPIIDSYTDRLQTKARERGYTL